MIVMAGVSGRGRRVCPPCVGADVLQHCQGNRQTTEGGGGALRYQMDVLPSRSKQHEVLLFGSI